MQLENQLILNIITNISNKLVNKEESFRKLLTAIYRAFPEYKEKISGFFE